MSFLEAHNGYAALGALADTRRDQVIDLLQKSSPFNRVGKATSPYTTSKVYDGTETGPVTVFRTAEDVARDLEKYSSTASDVAKGGGLLQQEMAFKFAATTGRLEALQAEVGKTEKELNSVKKTMQDRVEELARLGVMKPADIAIMLGKMGIAKMIPIFGWLSLGLELFGVDIFGSKKKKQKKAEEIMKHLEALAKQAEFLVGRLNKLNEEGSALAKAAEQGPSAVDVKIVGVAQHQEVKRTTDFDRGLILETKRTVDTKEKYMRTADEMKALGPTGARLPVGLQQIYSPALSSKSIVAKVETREQQGLAPETVTGKKLVFGGLAGPEADASVIGMWMTLGLGTLFVYMLATEPGPKPIRRKVPMYRPRMVA